MPLPRKHLIELSATSYYHCVSRCVRRAFLCGVDELTGKDYSERRGWLERRMFELTQYFTIDIASYAIMSNHYHIVLRVDKDEAGNLSDEEVIRRWHALFKSQDLTERYLKHALSGEENIQAKKLIEEWRNRLFDISWFMRCLNENIARRANEKDKCTGRFWEGRFKSQALIDDKAILTCMAYVDLNPIRAGISNSVTNSTHTSIRKRNRIENSPQKGIEKKFCFLLRKIIL